jgi:hypothetical protein
MKSLLVYRYMYDLGRLIINQLTVGQTSTEACDEYQTGRYCFNDIAGNRPPNKGNSRMHKKSDRHVMDDSIMYAMLWTIQQCTGPILVYVGTLPTTLLSHVCDASYVQAASCNPWVHLGPPSPPGVIVGRAWVWGGWGAPDINEPKEGKKRRRKKKNPHKLPERPEGGGSLLT